MTKSNTQFFAGKVKAARTDKATPPAQTLRLAGKKFHFIGAGGIGMSGLAKLLMKNKATVTGSDQTSTAVTGQLCRLGADIKVGHHIANLDPDTDAVVTSAAIKKNNPELQLAHKNKIRIYKYAQMLGLLMDRYDGIAIAGTHGKSTTTAWLTWALTQLGADPNYIVGAEISQLHSSSGTGNGRHFIAEACEYDRSFLNLNPQIACILNIEADHLDYYKDETEIVDAFVRFALNTRPDGVLVANATDPNAAKVIDKLPDWLRCETFGLTKKCGFSAKNIKLNNGLYSFDVYHNSQFIGRTNISIPGKHNISNALAVIAIAVNAGFSPDRILPIMPRFTGIDRRLMLKGCYRQITIVDDYAHHPTEIKASLSAIRQRYKPKRLWCIFQPHQYSRTRFLLDDFAESFKLADITIVPEIYFVRDSVSLKKQINAEVLVERIKANNSQALFIDSFEGICNYLKDNAARGDLVVSMGAGDIWKVADEYIHWLGTNR